MFINLGLVVVAVVVVDIADDIALVIRRIFVGQPITSLHNRPH